MTRPVARVVAALLIAPALLVAYRVVVLDYPLPPKVAERGWQLTLEGYVEPSADHVAIRIGFPARRPGRQVMDQEFTSSRLNVHTTSDGTNRFAEWTGVPGDGGADFGYRATVVSRTPVTGRAPEQDPWPAWSGAEDRVWAGSLARTWAALSAPQRLRAMAAAVAGHGGRGLAAADAARWAAIAGARGRGEAWLLLLKAAELPARPARGLRPGNRVATELESWIEAWTGTAWECLPTDGDDEVRGASSRIPLVLGAGDPVQVTGGEVSDLRWVLARATVSQWQNHFERIRGSDSWLDTWSLFHLPDPYRDTFRILVLVPLGALLIGFLRNVVGFPTFGMFMPVLMALAFRNTGLLYGLGLFGGIVLLGFMARRAVNRLRLLLVPRLSLILTLVILVIIVLAIAGNKAGKPEFMAVGLLPFVILTMTIERLFVVVEEAGARDGIRMALGSAAVAAITYAILNHEPLQLAFFMYPELLLAVAAAQVLLGRYTGYRWSEFYRFRRLKGAGEG